jgi:hypothetical protein
MSLEKSAEVTGKLPLQRQINVLNANTTSNLAVRFTNQGH